MNKKVLQTAYLESFYLLEESAMKSSSLSCFRDAESDGTSKEGQSRQLIPAAAS
jgi:hypothetical protein